MALEEEEEVEEEIVVAVVVVATMEEATAVAPLAAPLAVPQAVPQASLLETAGAAQAVVAPILRGKQQFIRLYHKDLGKKALSNSIIVLTLPPLHHPPPIYPHLIHPHHLKHHHYHHHPIFQYLLHHHLRIRQLPALTLVHPPPIPQPQLIPQPQPISLLPHRYVHNCVIFLHFFGFHLWLFLFHQTWLVKIHPVKINASHVYVFL